MKNYIKKRNKESGECYNQTIIGLIEKLERNISMLRQWLNEDRIDDREKMVTNKDIKHWLGIDEQIKELRK